MPLFFKTITAILALTLAGALFHSSPALAQERVKLAQFGKEKFLLYLPLYLGMEAGYFAQEGIDIDLVFAGNDDQIFAAVASGSVSFGMGDPIFTAIAQEKGFPAKTVAMMISKLGNTGFTNNPEIPLVERPEDLAGLRIGSFPSPSTTYVQLEEIVDEIPETLPKAKIVQAPPGAQLALLEAGAVDIAVDLEPAVSRLANEGYRIVFNLDEFTEPLVITGLMTREEVIEKRPDLVAGMVRALQKSLDTIHNDPEETARIALEIFPDIGTDVVRAALSRMLAKNVYPRSVVIQDLDWQRSLQIRLERGDLKRPQATEIAVDNRFAIEAAGEP